MLCLLAGFGMFAPWPAGAASATLADDSIAERVRACVACHGSADRATGNAYFPRIAGKPEGYLYNQLVNFRAERRHYPLMTHLVANLSDEYLRELARHFAKLPPSLPSATPAGATAAVLERGRTLVLQGQRSQGVPACIACHGTQLTGMLPATPGLLGLPRDYVNAQFGAWKNGTRRAHAPDCMAAISRALSAADIAAVSSWLAAQPVAHAAAPVRAAPTPLRCGTTEQP